MWFIEKYYLQNRDNRQRLMDTLDRMAMFVAVTELGSFTAAAERLGLSKNLVSKGLAELESRLGARLINRTTRSMSMTDAGQRYLGRCKQLLAELESLEDSVNADETKLRGTLRITAPATFGELYVVPAATEFSQQHREISINLQLNDRFADIVTEGFDLAIRIGQLSDSSLMARKLGTTEIWVVGHPDYVAKQGAPRGPNDLNRFNCVRDTNFRSGNAWHFVVDGAPQDIIVSGTMSVNSARSARDVALAGSALAYCPDYVVRDDVKAGRLQRLMVDVHTLTLPIHALYSNSRHLPARTRSFLEFMEKRLKECAEF
jgi:DNA-binding transcriptional LysR family regulator